jgi:hypothetical protein
MDGIPGSFVGDDRFERFETRAHAQADEGNERKFDYLYVTTVFVLLLDQEAIPLISELLRGYCVRILCWPKDNFWLTPSSISGLLPIYLSRTLD